MADKFPQMTPFAQAFAAAYRGFMKESSVSGAQIAAHLKRNNGYVSERVNGKRALDTLDIDALASLVDGWTGKALMIELARRAREASATAVPPSNVTQLRPNVSASVEDDEHDELGAVAKKKGRDRGGDDGQG